MTSANSAVGTTLLIENAPPDAVVEPKRHLGLKLGVIGIVWVVGWYFLQGRNTLAIGGASTNAFHLWLNSLRDAIQLALRDNALLQGIFGGLSHALDSTFNAAQGLISTAPADRPVPQIGWLGVVAILTWTAWAVSGLRPALLVLASTLAFGVLGVWSDGMDLLIVTVIAVVICIVIGMPLGIAMAKRAWVSRIITPVLDVMQTMPSFAYLAPLALLWGIGAPAAVVTTLIYAMPPLVRITEHAIRGVPATTVEASRSMGLTGAQMLRKVELPMARRTIIVGINQCVLAALSMATIAALVNGPGLGQIVAEALQRLDVGAAFVGGLAIVIMAIMLDRSLTAAGQRSERSARATKPNRLRTTLTRVHLTRPVLLGVGAIGVVILVVLSRTYVWAAQFPDSLNVGPQVASAVGSFTDSVVSAIAPVTDGFTNLVSYGLLNPLQSLIAGSPWWLMATVLIAVAVVLGGRKAGAVTVLSLGVVLGTGLWNDTMQTLTLTLVATILVMIIAVVVGVWMARSHRVDLVVRPILDAFQTIPSFVYLLPALALFGATRFTAIVAAVAYSMPIATKLVADGVQGVSPTTIEAATSVGTTPWQTITRVQLPMARSALVLATNQGLLYVLSMVVIGGLVGAGALGYLVVAGFSQGQLFGKGLAAGIAMTAIGVMLDRITRHAAARVGG